jgi:hypothetical protein
VEAVLRSVDDQKVREKNILTSNLEMEMIEKNSGDKIWDESHLVSAMHR